MTPLNEKIGIVEWVGNLTTFGDIVDGMSQYKKFKAIHSFLRPYIGRLKIPVEYEYQMGTNDKRVTFEDAKREMRTALTHAKLVHKLIIHSY